MPVQHTFWSRGRIVVSIASAALTLASTAHAQSQSPVQVAEATGGGNQLEEIVVTARKRQESILNVPVIESAIPETQLQRLQITDVADLPKIAPGLNLGHSLLSIGTLVSIRGIGTASQDPGVDQSVSLNIDGLSLGNGLAFESGLFDLGQIEVMKGPQALFFGKSSPGGVIALRTNDPTNEFEVIGRGAYELEARNPRGELIVSGPVNDTLKLRFASMYQTSDGYFHNVGTPLVGSGAVAPPSRAPDSKDYILRGTALWNPFDQFTARLKVNYVYDRALNSDTFQCTNAPTGTLVSFLPPFLGGGEDCRVDRDMRVVSLNPVDFPEALNNGVPFLETHQAYGTLELNYVPADQVTVTSVTAYYNLSSQSMVNPYETTYAAPYLGVNNHFHRREATEELRVTTDFAGPLNYTVGALYESGKLVDNVTVFGNYAYPPGNSFSSLGIGIPCQFIVPSCILQDGITPIAIKTGSVFAQVRWSIQQRLELAIGGRFTDERRTESPYDGRTGVATPVPVPELHPKSFSPEITLTYRPTDDLTTFAAWKRGFKSGSFSVATPVVANTNNSFGDEKVNGGELGLKSRWLDRQLTLDAAAYYYSYRGLQVGVISPPQNGVPVIQTLNAASALTYGIDLDGAYHPAQVNGLAINAALNWNHGRYQKFNNAPCWGGQLISEGCSQNYIPAATNPTTGQTTPGYYSAQDLAGTPLIRAPSWHATLGFQYEMPLPSDYRMIFTNSNELSSRYVTYLAADRPNNDNFQGGFVKVDLGLTLQGPKNLWEVAVIGKNINDKLTSGNCAASPLLTEIVPNGSGFPFRPLGIVDPAGCFVDPGREVWLRLTVRPFAAGR